MAHMLYRRHSARRHINATRRHMRLCRQYSCDTYAQRIKDAYNGLVRSHEALGTREEALENAHDDAVCKDRELENTIRSTFEKSRQYDRTHTGAPTLPIVFPEGSFGSVIKNGHAHDTLAARQIVRRLQALGGNHPLHAQIAELQRRIDALEAALDTIEQQGTEMKLALTEELLARQTLRERYRGNYYDARIEQGKFTAEQLFPRLYKPKISTEGDGADAADNTPAPEPESVPDGEPGTDGQ